MERQRYARIHRFAFAAAALFGVVVAVHGARKALWCKSLADGLKMDRRTTFAEVTATRKRYTYGQHLAIDLLVDYRFQSEGSSIPGSSGVKRSVWEEARRSGAIEVQYCGTNPRLNAPAYLTPVYGMVSYTLLCAGGLGIGAFNCYRLIYGKGRGSPPL